MLRRKDSNQCPPAGGYEPNEPNKKRKVSLDFPQNVAEKGFEPNVRRLADMSPTSKIKKGKFRLTFLKCVAEKGFEPMSAGWRI
jgi:hypothetical protein